MRTLIRLVILVALFGDAPAGWAAPPASTESKLRAIRFGKVVDGKGNVLSGALVVVDGNKIVSVGGPESAAPAGAAVIDLTAYTGIPGLIDVHTHMTFYWDGDPATQPWEQLRGRMPAVTVFLAQENARRTLEAGVTAVRDLGSSHYSDIAMRDLIRRGAMPGPHMFVAGYGLLIADGSNQSGGAVTRGRHTDTISEIQQAVKRQVAAGADVVKMYGSTGSGDDVSGNQTFTDEEMTAAVDAAHQLGRRIAIHSYGPAGARAAVRAGADSIEHATDIDDQTLAEMARRGTFYVPTIDHNRYYIEHREQFRYGLDAAERLQDYLRRNLETARRAHKAGVRFAMGSDAVFTMFGQNTRELTWFVEAGMTPAQALASATTNAATLLGMETRLGAIAPGYDADIVAVEGDPLRDIHVVVDRVRWVMKGGVAVVDKRQSFRQTKSDLP
jgi:imidazolonepropionase-like amidohydrolase